MPLALFVAFASALLTYCGQRRFTSGPRSVRLTGYLRRLLESIADDAGLALVTPADQQGAQMSVRVPGDAAELTERLAENWGVVADDRRPDIVRLAPAPLYCTFHDCWRAVDALGRELIDRGLA